MRLLFALWLKLEICRCLLYGVVTMLFFGGQMMAVERVEFFVATEGDDAQSGSEVEPFATLQRARDAVRQVEQKQGMEIRVWLRGGIYRLKKTAVFDLRDSVEDGVRVVYASYPGEKAIFSGAAKLTGEWEKSSREHLWEIAVDKDWQPIRALYEGDEMLPRARSRGYDPLARPPAEVPYRFRRAIDQRHLYLAKDDLEGLGDLTAATIELVPKFPWVMNRLTVESVDRKGGWIRTREPATYAMLPPAKAYFPKGSLWVENVLAVLDEPGEWVYDEVKNKLYLWPPDAQKPSGDITAGRLAQLLLIEGQVDGNNLKDKPVKGLSFHGLTFTQANAFGWSEKKAGLGLQHDWEMYDQPSAMVRLRSAERCVFTQCKFTNSASAGIRLDLHCQRNQIRRCEFADLGGVGVLLAGYGLGLKDVNRANVIADNTIHHIGKLWKHSPAIFLWQSGSNQVVHNSIRHVPYTAIVVSGRTQMDREGRKESSRTVRWDEVLLLLEGQERTWKKREPLMHGRFNTIAYNDISHCMELMGDGNAIYVSGTGRGNHLYHNFIHDITSANMNAAIRCDDDQHAVLIEKNVIARCRGEGIISKGRNDIVNNIIYDLRSKTPVGREGIHQRGYLVFSGAPVAGSRVQGNLFVSQEAGQEILFEHQKAWRHSGRLRPASALSTCRADRNLYFNSSDAKWANVFLAEQRKRGVEKNSLSLDPQLANPAKDDFRVGNAAVIRILGFEQIDISEVGVR
ncbi:MAG: right-handed parallel beta-helix repeat-containing protein [Verrucomicrobiales bacterium]|nr:right-handed parallel beta-helix repeat-containing protein [Verrucomicrobiales bacterium]